MICRRPPIGASIISGTPIKMHVWRTCTAQRKTKRLNRAILLKKKKVSLGSLINLFLPSWWTMRGWIFSACRLWATWCREAGRSKYNLVSYSAQMAKVWTWLTIARKYWTVGSRTKWVDGSVGAYEVSCRCEGKSTEETEQFTEEGEGHGYEHCERCTGCIWLSVSFAQ